MAGVPKRHDYRHDTTSEPWLTTQTVTSSLTEKVVFHHLDAYSQKFGLLQEMTTVSLFKPISLIP